MLNQCITFARYISIFLYTNFHIYIVYISNSAVTLQLYKGIDFLENTGTFE